MSADGYILPQNSILNPEDEFGDFQIVELIGKGLIGKIYSTVHMDTNESFALCVIPYRASTDLRFGARIQSFVNESQHYNHPGFPKVHGCSVIQGRFCIQMDPIHGRSLQVIYDEKEQGLVGTHSGLVWCQTQAIEKGDISLPPKLCFDEASVSQVLRNLAEMLTVVQSQRGAVLSLSPSYIFIDDELNVQVALSGLMATMGQSLFGEIVSSEISPVGPESQCRAISVIDVLSPEAQQGGEPHVKSDLFSVGVVAYWMLTGQFHAALPIEVPLKEMRPDLRLDWVPILEPLIDPDLDQRMASPQTLTSLIDNLGDGSTHAEPPLAENAVEKRKGSKSRKEKQKASLRRSQPKASGKQRGLLLTFGLGLGTLFIVGALAYFLIPMVLSEPEPEPVAAPVIQYMGFQVSGLSGTTITLIAEKGKAVELGMIDATGMLETKANAFAAGRYRLRAEHPDYRLYESAFLRFEGDRIHAVRPPLAPLPAKLEINTEPMGAAVFVAEILVGRTPLLVPDLAVGKSLVVRAELEGYRSVSKRVELAANEKHSMDLVFSELQQAELLVDVVLSDTDDSTMLEMVSIELEGAGVTPRPGMHINVRPGALRVVANHQDYHSSEQMVQLSDRDKKKVLFELKPKPGVVVIADSIPTNTRFIVDGVTTEPQQTNSGRRFFALTPRVDHSIRVEARDFLPQEQTVQVSPNRQIDLDFSLERIPGPQRGASWSIPYLKGKYVWIEAGDFQQGSPLEEHARIPNEGPVRSVTVENSFWMGEAEVTQALYESIMGVNPSVSVGSQLPVDSVKWSEAMAFCKRLTDQERDVGRLPAGYVYRLPTEVEWEYAARAGSDSPYSWGSTATSSDGNFSGVYPRGFRSDTLIEREGVYGSQNVMSFQANSWGLYDMHGNVREWTLNRFRPRLNLLAEYTIPESETLRERTQRGGGWEDFAPRCRSAAREGVSEHIRSNSAGFRVILAPEIAD